MTTAQLLAAPACDAGPEFGSAGPAARISFRQPVSPVGFIDAAWWPRSLDLVAELPSLLDVLWTAAREVNRITYDLTLWRPAPRRVQIEGRIVRLGGFATGEKYTVRLTDAWGKERLDVLVIVPDTDPAVARRALEIAGHSEDPYRAGEILEHAASGTGTPAARS